MAWVGFVNLVEEMSAKQNFCLTGELSCIFLTLVYVIYI
jgi:hypothetical protein